MLKDTSCDISDVATIGLLDVYKRCPSRCEKIKMQTRLKKKEQV